MTPEQIEVVGYYECTSRKYCDLRYLRVDRTHIVTNEIFVVDGIIVGDTLISEAQRHFLDRQDFKRATREAFNAAVDRVVSKVKGEA